MWRLREESKVKELKDEDNLLDLTVRVITIYYNNHILIIVQVKDSEFSAENNDYQKTTSRRLTVTVKHFKHKVWHHNKHNLIDAEDSNSASKMKTFHKQILNSDNIENLNTEWVIYTAF